MKILATDLDRTLLPNGSWPADPDAIELFNNLTLKNDVLVVYVTGRNLNLTEKAIAEFGIRFPHVLIGDVGTTIRMYQNEQWKAEEDWASIVMQSSPRWDVNAIREAVFDVKGLIEQDKEHCGPFKQSYYVDHESKDSILTAVDELIKNNFDEVIVYSYDSHSGKGLLDLLPNSATKQTALEYIADKFNVPKSEIVFCGDSGNDIFPLTAGFSGVLVKNADEQLVAKVKEKSKVNSDIKLYFAKGGFKGLSGYYTSGVIEGAYYYGIFTD